MKSNKKFSRCNDCNKLLSTFDHIRCAKCYHKYRIGYRHSKSSKKKMSIIAHQNGVGLWNKGRKRPTHSKMMTGNNNPNWRGGISSLGYPYTFIKVREFIRKRDNYKCQKCGISQRNHYRKLDIHHIDYNKKNCKENNLISLCNSCNAYVNFDRDYWYAYFTYIMDKK